jgi:hypothetical protein
MFFSMARYSKHQYIYKYFLPEETHITIEDLEPHLRSCHMYKEGALPVAQTIPSVTAMAASSTVSISSPSYLTIQRPQQLVSFMQTVLQSRAQRSMQTAHMAQLTYRPRGPVNQLALVTLVLNFGRQDKQSNTQQLEQSITHYLNNLRPLVRKNDALLRMDQTLYFVLFGADRQGGALVQERLWEALLWHVHNAQEQAQLQPISMTIGHSATAAVSQQSFNSHACVQAAAFPCHHFIQSRQSRQIRQSRRSYDTTTQVPERETEPLRKLQSSDTSNESVEIARSPQGDSYLLARQLGIPYIPQLPLNIPDKVRQVCSPQLAQQLHCYPIGRERNILTVAIADINSENIIACLHKETGLEIFPVLTTPQALQFALDHI